MSIFRSWKIALILPVVLAPMLATVASMASVANAQTYDELEVFDRIADDRTAQRKVRSTVNSVLSGETALEGAVQTQFDGWFVRFIFPQMTQVANVNEYTAMREDFITNYLRRTKSAAALKRLNELALSEFEKVAQGNFHPAARYNAMLIIGELNTRDEVRFGEKQPAEPSLIALSKMVNEFVNPQQIDIVRVAALIGIKRHMEIDAEARRMQPTARNYVVSRLEPLAASKSPPAEPGNFWMKPPKRSPEGHFWMKRMAMEILTLAAIASPNPAVNTLLVDTLKDEKLPANVRFEAAQLLGRLPNVKDVDALDTAKIMGGLLALDLGAQAKKIEEEIAAKEAQATAGGLGLGGIEGGGRFGGLIGGGPGDTEAWKVDRLCRYALQRCNEVKAGLVGPNGKAGLKPAATDPAAVDDMLKEINAIMEATKEPDSATMDNVLRRINVSTSNLKDLCKRKVPVPTDQPPVISDSDGSLGL